jgi:hypothetical protein
VRKNKTLIFACAFLLFAAFTANVSSLAARTMTDYPVVKLKSLDKITARTETFEARVGSTVKFDSLFIKVQSCRKSDPIEEPESASFLQIWEIDESDEAQWIFSGWMFASSPALSPMDHPIYDVWVIDCLSEQSKDKKDDEVKNPEEPDEEAVDDVPEESAEDEAQDMGD